MFQDAPSESMVVSRLHQVSGDSFLDGIHHTADGEGYAGKAMGSRLYSNHPKAFHIARLFNYRKDKHLTGGVGCPQKVIVNSAQEHDVSENISPPRHLDNLRSYAAGTGQGLAWFMTNNHKKNFGRLSHNLRKSPVNKLDDTLAPG
jgi:hypothetical protein